LARIGFPLSGCCARSRPILRPVTITSSGFRGRCKSNTIRCRAGAGPNRVACEY